MTGPLNNLILEVFRQFNKKSCITCHPDSQTQVILGLSFGFN